MTAGGVVLRLSYEPPYDWPAMLAFFRQRAVEGVEAVEGAVYRRAVRLGDGEGTIEVTDDPGRDGLVATVRLSGGVAVDAAVFRLRRMFDLDADLAAINAHLADDPMLAPLVAARPAVRVPGGWDGFEIAMRTVIGQQVSIAAARRLNGRLVERCGGDLPHAAGGGPSRLFPTPRQVMAADLAAMGMPGARVAALKAVAEAALNDPHLFSRAATVEETVARLRAVKGIGEWTAHYIAMRACREMDAFPASDVGLLRGAADAAGLRPRPADLLARAEAWRPWRAYAAQQIWAADAARAVTPIG
ncbi:DNA-3-methyladenine glycosylase family protein [Shumkonia mesophila]|uniref:DNA-3-methyladenine glycosylase family protein n=1 Tax=Shumkonia mesophila TaxID=2838854 RepID=UPI0029344C47|nr:AlkA N-terminal domain-containing protein [Shumkonia mesophila]